MTGRRAVSDPLPSQLFPAFDFCRLRLADLDITLHDPDIARAIANRFLEAEEHLRGVYERETLRRDKAVMSGINARHNRRPRFGSPVVALPVQRRRYCCTTHCDPPCGVEHISPCPACDPEGDEVA